MFYLRSPGTHPQQEKRKHPQNLSSESISKVEDIMEEDEINTIDSGNECDGNDAVSRECNGDDKNDEAENNSTKTRYDGRVLKYYQRAISQLSGRVTG